MQASVILGIVCVLARVSAFIAFVPLFSRRQLPALVKAGLAMALTVFWLDSAPRLDSGAQLSTMGAGLLLVKEVGIGALLAMVVGLVLVPARIAGSYIGQEIGISMEPVTNAGLEQSTIVAMIFETFAVLLFFGLNLHHFMILVVHHSFGDMSRTMSLSTLPTEGLVGLVSRLPEYGFMIVAPIGIVGFLLLISLFLLNKAAPTLNLFSIGMPLRVGLGLLAVFIFLPVLWRSMQTYFYSMISDIEQFLGFFH